MAAFIPQIGPPVNPFFSKNLTRFFQARMVNADDDEMGPTVMGTTPLDGEMLGLEEEMNENVVDIRPDRFLRAMRDSGDWIGSCQAAGLTSAEAEALCQENPKFDLSLVECQLEYHEEKIIEATEKAFDTVRAERAQEIQGLREQAMRAYNKRWAKTG